MTRVFLLEEYDEVRGYWNRRAVVDNALTADRWRRNKPGRKFTDYIVYNHEEFCKYVEEVEAKVCTNPTPMDSGLTTTEGKSREELGNEIGIDVAKWDAIHK